MTSDAGTSEKEFSSASGRVVFLLLSIAVAVGVLVPRSSWAAITYVQSANNYTAATVTTLSKAFNSNNTAGDFIVVWASWTSHATTASVKDSNGNFYQSLSILWDGQTDTRGQIFYARNIAGGSNTVTLTISNSGSAHVAINIHEYSGVDPASPIDVETNAHSSGTNPNSGSATTTIAGDLLFGVAAEGTDESPWTAGGSYNMRETNVRSATEDQIANSTGSSSAAFAVPTSAFGISEMVAFKLAGTRLQVGSRSDTLSNSQPSATSNHTFAFTVNSPITGSSTLALALPGQFTLTQGIRFVQGESIFSGPAVSSLAQAFDSNNTAGNLVVVSAQFDSSFTAAISDSQGNLYATAVGNFTNPALSSRVQIWYAKNINGGANTVTLTFSGSVSGPNFEIHEYRGADQTSPLDATSSNTGTGMLYDSGSATTTVANELIFGFGDAPNYTLPGAGFMLREADVINSVTEDQIAPSGGSHDVTFRNQISGNWSAAMATFKPASSSLALDCGDVDAATSVQFNFNYPSCAATATAWGFAADAAGSKFTLQAPLVSASNVYVPTSTQITINIGSNATVGQQGAHWITNPSSAGIYTISVGGTFGGSGNILVSINAGVTVQATVAESLALTVSSVAAVNCTADDGASVTAIGTTSTTIPFGNVSLNTFYIGCQDLVVSTNAGNGYSITTQESSVMKTANGNSTIPDTTCDGGTCSESGAAAWTSAAHNGLGHTCFNQDGNHDCDSSYTNGTSGKNFRQFANIAAGETPQAIMSSTTPATVTGRIKIRLSAGAAQAAGTYTTLITYTILGTF